MASFTVQKVFKYGVFSGLYFPLYGLNTEIYGINLRIQSEYRKTQTRKNSVFGHFSRNVGLNATFEKEKRKQNDHNNIRFSFKFFTVSQLYLCVHEDLVLKQ